MLRLYDIRIDDFREATQADLDNLATHTQAFGNLYAGIKAMAEDARLQALGKLSPLAFDDLIRKAREP